MLNTTLLVISVYATALNHPSEYLAMRVLIDFDTRFVCEKAHGYLDTQLVSSIIEKRLAKTTKHVTVRRLEFNCVEPSSTGV